MQKDLKKLKEERGDLFRKMERILQAGEARNGRLTDDEAREYDGLEKQFDELTERIERLENQATREREIKRAGAFPDTHGTDNTRPVAQIKGFQTRRDELPPEDFWRCLAAKDYGPLKDYRAENRSGAKIGIGTAGGFAIPEVTRLDVLDSMLQDQGIFSRISKEFPAAGSDTLTVVTFENCDIDDEGLYGFSTPQIIPEGGTITGGTPKLNKRTWNLKKMVLETKISLEMATNPQATNVITSALRGVINYGIEKFVVRGAGAQQTVGLIDSECGINYTRAGAGAISYPDVYNMIAVGRPGGNPCWLASQTIIPQLAAMVDAGNHAVWLPGVSGGAAQAMPQQLLGHPILFNIGVNPTLGNTGDLIYSGDLAFFKCVMWGDFFVQTSESAHWSTGEIGVRVIVFLDMGTLPTKPITLDGQTYGWHVVLK